MDLTTTYCGLPLAHPFMPGASPMADDLGTVRALEDAGASAIVMHSLFEEQVVREELVTSRTMEMHNESFAEAVTYMPFPEDFQLGPMDDVEHVAKLKAAVDVPVIASLNGTTPGGSIEYGQLIEQAGADALELNLYRVPTKPEAASEDLEHMMANVVTQLRSTVALPRCVKLSPYHTALPHLATRLQQAGDDGLVLFNRHFHPDLDIDSLDVVSVYHSDPAELPLRLRGLGILDAQVPALSYAATGGVHTLEDAIKALMSGADAVQLVTRLLRDGPAPLTDLITGLSDWLEAHEYPSLDTLRGCMNLHRCPNPGLYTRAHYVKLLQGYA